MPQWLTSLQKKKHLTSAEKKTVLKTFETLLKELSAEQWKLRKQEKNGLEIARQSSSILQSDNFEEIQRNKTSITRHMYRATEQLERLQRRRSGESLPPTVNVKVARDNDD